MKRQLLGVVVASVFAHGSAEAKEPRHLVTSNKSVEQLAGCIALTVSESRGYELSKVSTAVGLTLKMKFRAAGIAATAATYEIEDLGSERRLKIYATGKASGAPRTIAAKAATCAD